ncbi:regulator of chromosome condensation (RCC1) family with FYVE zinc finger domain-containing protein [Actinidia rufa]|uniref:Regulator of chromosome condensation (RCC1) family with FYVE zinc finger domain-containing protein n=1 Tax=Actinidia rufa TaxID=165716 RepID=A0A7J0DDN7_9ERIC|nr:regulator of chromosome condensation (RCC1) family with FYVE zinc finger domain-containing protein [Actinidia rufa]
MAASQRGSLAERDIDQSGGMVVAMKTVTKGIEVQAITALKKGAYLLKYGRRGKPKFCPFRLSTDESALIWYYGKEEKQLELCHVTRIIPGQRTAIFQRYPRPEKEYQSFSLIYNDNDRSLDLICKDKDEAEVWFVGLKALISRGTYRNLRNEAINEGISLDSPLSRRTHLSCSSSDQGDIRQVESLPHGRLGKAFSDIISYTAASQYQPQPQPQPEPETSSLSSLAFVGTDNSSSRSLAAEAFRVSLSSAVSSSSHGSGHEDFDALGDVLIWGEGIGDGVMGGDVHRIDGSSNTKMDALFPKALESTMVLDVHNIACGKKHAVLVTKQGQVFSWGEESGGRLGHGVEVDVSHPKLIDALIGMNIELVACGEYHTCAVTFAGDLYTWGDGTHNCGLLGHGSEVSHWIPKKVRDLHQDIHVSYIACGPWHTAFVTSAGQLFTFGDGTFGALGHGDHRSIDIPREVGTLRGLRTVKVACGVWHSAAIVDVMTGSISGTSDYPSSGKLFTWGDGDKGRLGHGDKDPRLVPECVAASVDVSFCQVACGHNLTVSLTTSGRVYTMGSTAYGQLGSPLADGKTPTCIEAKLADSFVEEIACGSYHVAVLTSKTEVYTWGSGANGQLGHGDNDNRNTPTLVGFLKDKQVKSVACGANFTAVICLHKLVSTTDNSVCSGCRNPFNFRRKRNNCYNCGLVFCQICSSRKSLKASLAPSMNKPYRVCDDCFNKLKKAAESESITRIPQVKSGNRLKIYNDTAEKEIGGPRLQGQLSRLSSFDSFNLAQGRNSKLNIKSESNGSRVFPLVNGNTQREIISSSKASNAAVGASKNFFSVSIPGSRMVSRASSPVSRKSTPFQCAPPASSLAVGTSEVIPGDSKHKNEELSQEVINLRAQAVINGWKPPTVITSEKIIPKDVSEWDRIDYENCGWNSKSINAIFNGVTTEEFHCPNKRKTKEIKVLTVTWSDSEKEDESDDGDEYENFTAFINATVETNKISSKGSDTKKSDESDGTIGSQEEESDEEDKNELQQAYNQLYKQLYNLVDAKVEDLTSKSQLLEAELERTSRQLKVATELAADEAEKCKAEKEVIQSLTAQALEHAKSTVQLLKHTNHKDSMIAK